jgi:hypothetical protein
MTHVRNTVDCCHGKELQLVKLIVVQLGTTDHDAGPPVFLGGKLAIPQVVVVAVGGVTRPFGGSAAGCLVTIVVFVE